MITESIQCGLGRKKNVAYHVLTCAAHEARLEPNGDDITIDGQGAASLSGCDWFLSQVATGGKRSL